MKAKKNDDILILRELIKELPNEAKIARLGFEKLQAVRLADNDRDLAAKAVLREVQ